VGPSTPQARHDGGARPPALREPGRKAEAARKDSTAAKQDAAGATASKVADESASGRRQSFNAPSTRTNIALPFSKIEVQEPSAELSELAGLLCELIETIERAVPKTQRKQLNDLLARAQVLRARMR
jgi:hypothetical protein